MRTETMTFSEIAAYQLLYGGCMSSADGPQKIHEAGNRIIAWAERIKAERAVAAMQREEATDGR